jgi:IS30 family transposase
LSYTHFTLSERKYLQQLLSEDKSFREIAAILERSPSSISREVNRNRAKHRPHNKPNNKYWYNHWRAENLYIRRRREQQRRALKENTPEWDFIIEGLKKFWSPEAICGRWQLLNPNIKPLCVSTIYRYIQRRELPGITAEEHLRRRNKRRQTRNANYNTIQPDRIIPDWPEEIKKRRRLGDWEGDTVYGGVGKGLVVTLADRNSRYFSMGKLHNRTAALTEQVIVQLLKDKPVKSLSLDNGSEFANFKSIEKQISAPIYFAEPHKPWQRGTNENTNDILRFFYPKGTNFHNVSDEELKRVEYLINTRPRKCLGWKSPFEVFWGVALG